MIVLGSLSSLKNTLGVEDQAASESLNGAVMSFEKKRFVNIYSFLLLSNLQCFCVMFRSFNLSLQLILT